MSTPDTEQHVAQFFGGPWDGEVRQVQTLDHRIEVAMFGRIFAGTVDTTPAIRTGTYHLAYTKFGDPWRYEWSGP